MQKSDDTQDNVVLIRFRKGWLVKDTDDKVYWYPKKPVYDKKFEHWNPSLDMQLVSNLGISVGLNLIGGPNAIVRIPKNIIVGL